MVKRRQLKLGALLHGVGGGPPCGVTQTHKRMQA